MRWYDLFARTYDRQLEGLYRPYRGAAHAALRLGPGARVLDLACGTGQNLDGLLAAIGPAGRVVGVDVSPGMLGRARERVRRLGADDRVTLVEADATRLDADDVGGGGFDGVLCTLGLTAMPAWQGAFARSFGLLRPGGRYVLLDVVAERRTLQAWLVERIARADLDRHVWEPLAAATPDFVRTPLGAPARTFGGVLYVAEGTRPA